MEQSTGYILPGFNNTTATMPFQIHSFREAIENRGDTYDAARSNDHFEIIWIIKGSGTNYIDLKKSKIEDNQLFCIQPGQIHRIDDTHVLEGYTISFTESFLNAEGQETNSTYDTSLFQLFANSNGILITNDIDDMKYIAERMMKEFESFNAFRTEILKRYFKIFLIYITRQFDGLYQLKRQTRNTDLVQKFLALLEKNFKTKKMVAGYACQLLLTPNYLNEIVKKTTGYSAGYHIRQRIVMEAKRQATYSDISMKEIAYFLGFCNMAHFSKFFKNATGINFTDFKKEKFVFSSLSSLNSGQRA